MKVCGHPPCDREVKDRHRLCSMHRARQRRGQDMDAPPPPQFATPEERFWSHVDKRGPDDCWLWAGGLTRGGYGGFSGLRHLGQRAHRIAYQLAVGPIPDGLDLDHTCHDPSTCTARDECPHRRCCNPRHLEPVSRKENVERSGGVSAGLASRTHCPQGHEFMADNTFIEADGSRRCRECKNANWRKNYWRRKEAS